MLRVFAFLHLTNGSELMKFIDRYFELTARQSSIKKELIAGLTAFMAMSYILFVNPSMLAQTGMDHGAVFVATCLAAAFGSIAMGMLANLPVALAPGMGLNAFFTYVIVLEQGHSWQTALAAVFCSGVLFLLLSIFKIREWIIQSIPFALKMGIAAGIGMFLALIALKTANIIVASPATLVTLGDVLFETNRADVKPGAQASLRKLADFLQQNPSRSVLIEGHTDSVGSDAYNDKLSRERAQAVANYLVSRGISGQRLIITGAGERYPIASNDTEAGRAENRRVEMTIVPIRND